MTPSDLVVALVSTLAIGVCSSWCRPARARCPSGYDLRTGIRRSGAFECWPHVVGDPTWDGTFGHPERGVQSRALIAGQLYCTGGARAIVVDDRTVGCQR